MNFKVCIGLNIQNLRHSKGLSQEQLALAAEIDRSYISEIELAKSSVSADKLEKIAHALDVDPSELCKPRNISIAEIEQSRLQAEPIGHIYNSDETKKIGLLYRWKNGEIQAAVYDAKITDSLSAASHSTNKDNVE